MSARAMVPMKPVAARTLKPAPGLVVQRKCDCGSSAGPEGECEDCKKKKLQRRATGHGPGTAPPIVHEVLRTPGQPLDEQTRSFFEPRFGHDFSKVRVHADSRAHESARAVNALAYTVGNDLVFGAGQLAPATKPGQRLLAHELTHVIQQSGSSPAIGAGSLVLDTPSNPLEAEADRASTVVLARAGIAPRTRDTAARGLVQRAPAEPAPANPAEKAPTAQFSGCDQPLQDDLRAKQAPALERVNHAVTALSHGWKDMDPVDQGSFRQFFDPAESGEIDESFVKDVRSNFQIILGYMRNLKFECNPDDWTICGKSKTLCRPGGNLMWTCFGALHVCPEPYRRAGDPFKIETMIHESTHNALHTTDREYSNNADFKRLKPRGSLGWRFLRNIPVLGQLFRLIRANNDTILNPDSYAGFAMKAGGGLDGH